MPRNVLYNLNVMITHLNDDSYIMRNAIIHALSRVVSQILCKDNSEAAIKARDDLLSILEERFKDTNAYTRSKVIQCWTYLCEEKATPFKNIPSIIGLVRGRLLDKSAFVRKAALQFLSTFLSNNPYTGPYGLRRSQFVEEQKKIDEQLSMESVTQSSMKRYLSQKVFVTEALRAIDQIEECIPVASEILDTTTSSDVTECVEFLARAYLAQVENSENGIKRMMKLIWSREQSIRDAVLNAFEQLFLSRDKYSNPSNCISMARKIISLVKSCNLQELTAFEAIITLSIHSNIFPKHLFLALFELYTSSEQVPDPTDLDCSGAALLLKMIANARPAHLRKRIKTLLKYGLGQNGEKNPLLVLYTCDILERLVIDDSTTSESKEKPDEDILGYIGGDANFKLPPDHAIFNRLAQLLCGIFYDFNFWIPIADRALRCIFTLCDRPTEVANRIINTIAKNILLEESSQPSCDAPSNTLENMHNISSGVKLCAQHLTKLFFVLGHSALKELVCIEAQHKKAKKIETTCSFRSRKCQRRKEN
jgi:condensin complex subunit 1